MLRRIGRSLSVHVLGREDEADSWHSTEADAFEPDGSLDTRQNTLTRAFVSAPLEKAFVRRAFPYGRGWVRLLLCAGLIWEAGLLMAGLACQCGARWELAGRWYIRIFTMGVPFPMTALGLAFTYSHRCTPRTMKHGIIWYLIVLSLVFLVPNALAMDDTTQEIVSDEDGNVHTDLDALKAYKNLVVHYVVFSFIVSTGGTVIGHAGGLSPPASILLCAVCLALHASLPDTAWSARFGSELSMARTWWHPFLSVLGCTAVQAYALSALRRRAFVAQLLTAAQRIEQLSREKELTEWQRALSAMKQRVATRQNTAPSEHEPTGSAQGDVDLTIGEVGPIVFAALELGKLGSEASSAPAAALPRGPLSTSDPSNASDGEIVAHLEQALGANDPEAGAPSTAPLRLSGSPGLVALRHELLAALREIQARKATTHTLAETGVTIGASLSDAPSFAGPPSVATSATAADLHRAFDTEPRNGTIATTSRPKRGRAHPLRAFVMALYGQRPPGPMPGQMPPDVEAGAAA